MTQKKILFIFLAGVIFSILFRPVEAKKHVPLDLAVFHNNQGVTYLSKNDLDRAEVEFKTAAELDPLYAEAHNNLGLIYKYKGHYDLAIGQLEKAIKLKPKWAAPYNHLGAVYLAKGELERAVVNIKKATEQDKKFADAFANLGVVYLEKAKKARDPKPDWKKAVHAFQKATTLDTRLFHAHMDLADTYRKLGELEKAILRYRVAIETNPEDPTAWEHLGELYVATGDSAKAEECFEKVRMMGPISEETLLQMGEGSLKQKKIPEALVLFNRALEANPRNPMTYFDIGFALTSIGKLPQAISAYQRAIALRPDFFEAYFNLGDTFSKIGDLRGAIQSFQQALRLRQDHPESLFQLADLYNRALNPQGALEAYCRFLQVAKGSLKEEVKKAKTALKQLGECPS